MKGNGGWSQEVSTEAGSQAQGSLGTFLQSLPNAHTWDFVDESSPNWSWNGC